MNVIKSFRRIMDERRAVRELSSLDDMALQDIGVSRSHIRSAVKGSPVKNSL